ncbi:toll-like receptor 1 [Spea bombifrons]|uniref:toll-like receptor 1 n=1 Tax=Spea bombifrons TaxID=233779 RepID=UPI00234BBE38|nr:toll-like receptor 1 [Spea bombifrons]
MTVFFCLLTLAASLIGSCHSSPHMIIANYSGQWLTTVPKNLSSWTNVLDLAFNFIHAVEQTDFSYMTELKVLNVSHNSINDLNCTVFAFNKKVEYIDLSNNKLKSIAGIFPETIRHLDISTNYFKTMSMCKGFGNLLQLEYLGIGATQVFRSDFEPIARLQLQYVLIELQGLTDYDNGSIAVLNTKNLHIILPSTATDPYNVLLDAVKTSEVLELSNVREWNLKSDPKKYMTDIAQNSIVTHLTLSHFVLDWHTVVNALQSIWHSSVESLRFYDLTLSRHIDKVQFDYSNTSMKALLIQKASTTEFQFKQSDLYSLFADMNIENLTITDANILFMVCPLESSPLKHINFANNALTDDVFQECATLKNLESLEMAQNKLEKVSKISSMTRNMPSLKHLDISHNLLHYDGEDCHWSNSITRLNMASCDLTNSIFKCLPRHLETLILKNNEVTHVPLGISQFENLKELNLASNRLSDLPDCSFFKGLVGLNVEYNQIFSPSQELIEECHSVHELRAGGNPFQCDCEIKNFITFQEKSPGKIIGWPDDYICEHPEDTKGTTLKDLYIPEIYCIVYLLIAVIVLPIVFLSILIFGLCKYFDGPWYLKMLWKWTRTKHRVQRKNKNYQELQRDLVYHAFVSYSEHDSSWVKHTLLPNLEKNNSSLQICQHERNFVPGKSIVENIIDCIDKSYKSIFVLSPNFVQSEWCHYELYFAHHKLYTENTDNLILILLEPIPQYLIPSKYYKLKTLMAQRTYLEWPKETRKHGLFWANLRASININVSNPETPSSLSNVTA